MARMAAEPPAGADQPDQAPLALAVVRGEPDATEIAALVAVLAARLAARETPARERRPDGESRHGWSAPSRALRQALAPGPGAWRASALPR